MILFDWPWCIVNLLMFIDCITFDIVNWERFVIYCRNRLLKKCSEIEFITLKWLMFWMNQTSLSCVDCNERSLLFD